MTTRRGFLGLLLAAPVAAPAIAKAAVSEMTMARGGWIRGISGSVGYSSIMGEACGESMLTPKQMESLTRVRRSLPTMQEQPSSYVPTIEVKQPRRITVTRKFQVYLAGPITGLTYDGAEDWRCCAKTRLAKFDIKAFSPLRAKDYLRGVEGVLTADCKGYGDLHCLSSPRGIMTRDRFDATHCDVLLVNLLGADRVSIGTVMEMAWADLSRIPIVVAMEPTGNVHEHAMISEAIGFRVATLEDAIHVVKAIADNPETFAA